MSVDEHAVALDHELDRIIRGEVSEAPAAEGRSELDELVATARLLHAALPRFHPRFGFEEVLAAQLGRRPSAAPSPPIPFPVAAVGDRARDARRVWDRYRRELVAGGAIASGVSIALPLAGAALVRGGRGGGLVVIRRRRRFVRQRRS